MSSNRSQTGKQRYPAFQGRLIYDTYRGQGRVRSWPRPRGPSPLEQQQIQTEWFKAANLLAVKAAPSQMAVAIESTRNTGLYPRDVIVRAMGAGLIDIIDENGILIQYRQDRLEKVVFQGVILRPAGNPSSPANTPTYIQWELPVLDTASFWDVTQPTRITVPEGVTVMVFYAGAVLNGTLSTRMIAQIRRNRAEAYAYTRVSAAQRVSQTLSSGPTVVVPGDYYELNIEISTTGSLLGGGYTFFGAEVVQTI